MIESRPPIAARIEPALVVVLAGVCAALHVSKLAPAIGALQESLGVTLVQAGFLLSLVQMAGMLFGIAVGLAADRFGARRSITTGLLVLAGASLLGGAAGGVVWLMLLRAAEGFGFLLVVLPAPGLVRRLVAPHRLARTFGLWGAYMPFGTAAALLVGPVWVGLAGWRAWWWLLGGVTLAFVPWFVRAVPATVDHAAAGAAPPGPWRARLARTLSARGPWLVAATFAAYSGQWLAVIGFLPAIYAQAGVSAVATGVLTALAAAVNMVGNVMTGRLLQRGVAPTALMNAGFVAMAVATWVAYAGASGGGADAAGSMGGGAPPALRYLAVLAFSMLGGLIPATLFSLSVRVAPGEQTVATTVGWMQQWSAFGQFFGPPLVAWVASRVGDWHSTWLVTGACSLVGLVLVRAIGRLESAPPTSTSGPRAGP